MMTIEDILTFVEEENVKFIRLAFFDLSGKQKNISIQPDVLEKAYYEGIRLDASLITGFEQKEYHDLYLKPDLDTMSILPWRSIDGEVIRLYCNIYHRDDTPFEMDVRYLLKNASQQLQKENIHVDFGSEIEFYLFKQDEQGHNTYEPLDNAGYFDISPEDQGENIRRDICLTLADMGLGPESSHHEQGPGQNEVDFQYNEPVGAADNAATFMWVVKATAEANGLVADFSPKPLQNAPGNSMHINISLDSTDHETTYAFAAGIMKHMDAMRLFLNSQEDSYKLVEYRKAPEYISWSYENRHQLIRIFETRANRKRIKIRLADPSCNIYLAYMLIIQAGLDGIKNHLTLPEAVNIDLYTQSNVDSLKKLPGTLMEAKESTKNDTFIQENVPESILEFYLNH